MEKGGDSDVIQDDTFLTGLRSDELETGDQNDEQEAPMPNTNGKPRRDEEARMTDEEIMSVMI